MTSNDLIPGEPVSNGYKLDFTENKTRSESDNIFFSHSLSASLSDRLTNADRIDKSKCH
jgi:hypothetical protein